MSGMKKAFCIITVLLILPACGKRDEPAAAPVDIEKTTKSKELTAAFVKALKQCDYEKMKELILIGADVNVKDNKGKTVLDLAFTWGSSEILLKYGAKSGELYRYELLCAVRNQDIEKVRELLGKGANSSATRALCEAANPFNYTSIGGSVSKDTGDRLVAIAKLLIDNGADLEGVKSDDKTPLHAAVSCGNTAFAKFLVEAGADMRASDSKGCRPIHAAANHGNKETVEYLLSVGADVMARDKNGYTPLHYAFHFAGVEETVALLISKGADVNAVDKFGMTPLHWAAREYSKENVELLLKSGAEVNKKDNNGRTPLHYALERSHIAFFEGAKIKVLIDAGADINSADNNGNTSLHVAAMNRCKGAVEFLLSRGADASIANKEGKLPKDLADDEETRKLFDKKPEESNK